MMMMEYTQRRIRGKATAMAVRYLILCLSINTALFSSLFSVIIDVQESMLSRMELV